MIGGLTLIALAAVVAVVGRTGWRSADTWAAQAWEDPHEQEHKRVVLRRGALACWVAAGALGAAGAISSVASLL